MVSSPASSDPCPCGSKSPYADCCEPYLTGRAATPTAEKLMRSRYSAYVVGAIDYLGETLHPSHRTDWDREATRRWADDAAWLGLEILKTENGRETDSEGIVEFIASYREQGVDRAHRERSVFRRHGGRWYYVEGEGPKPQPQRNVGAKIGRNDPCPCGSGKKYKRCCGA